MANDARRAGTKPSSSSGPASAAMRGLTLPLVVGVVLAFGGCQNGGATRTGTPKGSGGDASPFVYFPGTSYQSVDGGAHWIQVSSYFLPRVNGHELPKATGYESTAISPAVRWEAVSTTDGTSSVVTIAGTQDNGHTWHQVALPRFAQPSARPIALQFLDATHGWLEVDVSYANSRRGLLFSTQDGGSTWASASLPFSGSIVFASYTVGWLVGAQWATVTANTLARTDDGGKTWTSQTLPLPESSVSMYIPMGQPFFFDRQNGIVPVNVGQSTVIYATHNGGTSWAQTTELANTASDFQAQPFDTGSGRSVWIKDGRRLFVTHDAGATWATVQPDTDLGGAELVAYSDTKVFALTAHGMCPSDSSDPSSYNCTNTSTILGTTDGGQTWETLRTDVSQYP